MSEPSKVLSYVRWEHCYYFPAIRSRGQALSAVSLLPSSRKDDLSLTAPQVQVAWLALWSHCLEKGINLGGESAILLSPTRFWP